MTAAKKTTASLQADLRDGKGKGVARALRREGKVPGTIYGKGQTPMSIALSLKDLTIEYSKGRFRSRLVELKLGDKQTIQALPKDLQFNPVTDVIEHVDFIKVEKGVAVRVSVPVKAVGQDKAIGIKRGGVMNIVRHEIDFFCAPDAIPTHLEVNVSAMDIGTSLHINSIELPKGITPVIKRNFTVITIAGRSKEEEAPAAGAAATPAAGAAAPAAGAAAAPAAAKKDEKKK
ncbi:MAG: 50S ribosomal protein L25/general stress protein Ctc [Alphaproteobacteria bacterium]|nr:50S ribosomal protein L25/general stress protein Ctc [Alphaproteobacteria bacterium]